MQLNRNETLESLLVSTTRLTRTAAQRTGTTVSSAVWSALSVLTTDGPHRIGDLARAARVSQPGMTKVLQSLVTDEWVLRIADTDDSRAWLIAISDKGRAALVEWRRQLADALAGTFENLTESEWEVLDRAAEILDASTTQSTNSKEHEAA